MIDRNTVFIIGEAGVNHNGDIKLAYELVDIAKDAGVDAVKFQTYKTDKVISPATEMADYQKQNLCSNESQYEMVKKLELTYEDFRKIQDYCNKKGILFLSTADEEESLDYLTDDLNIPVIKMGSSELTSLPFLKHAARKNKPVILSTGMANLGEIETAIDTMKNVNPEIELYLLHCTTNYPTQYSEVNLMAMKTISEAFKLPVGYSDHTLGIEIPIAAVALGAKIIEKHFTIDKNMTGPDHVASLNPKELAQMVKSIRNIELAMGDGIKKPNKSEESIKRVVRRTLVAAKDLSKGKHITMEDITLKRADCGIDPKLVDILIGKQLVNDIQKDRSFTWEHFMVSENE